MAATAKARAAKAAKRTAIVGESGPEAATNSSGFKARKSSSSALVQKNTARLRGNGAARNKSPDSESEFQGSESEAEDFMVDASQETAASQYVEDTDSDEYVHRSTRNRKLVRGSGNSTRRRAPGRPHTRAFGPAPIVAAEKKTRKGKVGGVRPPAGRKRKRPVVLNSDDE